MKVMNLIIIQTIQLNIRFFKSDFSMKMTCYKTGGDFMENINPKSSRDGSDAV